MELEADERLKSFQTSLTFPNCTFFGTFASAEHVTFNDPRGRITETIDSKDHAWAAGHAAAPTAYCSRALPEIIP